jgi:hypothetical protein
MHPKNAGMTAPRTCAYGLRITGSNWTEWFKLETTQTSEYQLNTLSVCTGVYIR